MAELREKVDELLKLIKRPEDVLLVRAALGSKRDMMDRVEMDMMWQGGSPSSEKTSPIRVYPKRLQASNTLGCVKVLCSVYVRRYVLRSKTEVIPLSEADVKLLTVSGYADNMKYEAWKPYASYADTFTYPHPKSKICRMCDEAQSKMWFGYSESHPFSFGGTHSSSNGGAHASSIAYTSNDGWELYTGLDPYIETVCSVSAYLYFRRAFTEDFIPSKEYTILKCDGNGSSSSSSCLVENVKTVWCAGMPGESDYIGFRPEIASEARKYLPYVEMQCENTAILEELEEPICILEVLE